MVGLVLKTNQTDFWVSSLETGNPGISLMCLLTMDAEAENTSSPFLGLYPILSCHGERKTQTGVGLRCFEWIFGFLFRILYLCKQEESDGNRFDVFCSCKGAHLLWSHLISGSGSPTALHDK